jgi:hypothetical protein
MNGSTPRIRIGKGLTSRWREWARALAGARVTRRRAPLQLAFLRRSRTAVWIAQRNVKSQHFAGSRSIVVKPLLQLALHQQRLWNSVVRTSVVGPSSEAPAARVAAVRQADPGAPVDLRHRWTVREERTQSRTLLRDIVERTRRLEEKVRVDKRLVARAAPSPAAAAQAQEDLRRAGPDWWKEPTAHSVRPAPAPAVNINEIAETVMRRLDHRVSAWRERMGRM